MKDNKPKTEESWQEEPTYQTGSTNPPKTYWGILAFLLALVIFLCGISTALGLMNIRLFRELSTMENSQEDAAMAFSEAAPVEAKTVDDAALVDFPLGFTGQAVPDFWQLYHELPQGVYITEVLQDSPAALCGLLPGDVLTHLDGIPVPNTDILLSLLETDPESESLAVEVCRDGTTMTITIADE